MKSENLSSLESFPYFTIEAVKQLLGDESVAAGTIQTTLYRWMKAGQIIQLKKGVYMTRRFFEQHRADVDFAPMASAILIPKSYLSLEYILQRNAILTEITYPVTGSRSNRPVFSRTNWELLLTAISKQMSIRVLNFPNTWAFQ